MVCSRGDRDSLRSQFFGQIWSCNTVRVHFALMKNANSRSKAEIRVVSFEEGLRSDGLMTDLAGNDGMQVRSRSA
jgi:hypothetical protein